MQEVLEEIKLRENQAAHFSVALACSQRGVTALTVMAALESLSRRLDVGDVSAITGVLSAAQRAAGRQMQRFRRSRGRSAHA